MTVSFCGSLATACASSFQHAFIGNSAPLQWSDVRLTGTCTLTSLRKRGILANKRPGYYLKSEYHYLLQELGDY
jgi:hypothetical protein